MALAINAALSAGPEGTVYPRFWAGSTVNVRGRVLLDNGDTVQGEGVSFLFRWVADRSVQIELAGLWDPAAKLWRCAAELNRLGPWEVRLLCLLPQRQTAWLPLEVVDTPGSGNAPSGGLWVSQQNQALMTMTGAGLTGVRIAELLAVDDPSDLTLPGVRADGSDARVSWAVIAQGAQDAIAGEVQAVEVARQEVERGAESVETVRQQVVGHAGDAALSEQVALGAADMAREERLAAQGAADTAVTKAGEAVGAAGAASGSAGAAASAAGVAGAAAEAAAAAANQATTTVSGKANKVGDTLTNTTLSTGLRMTLMPSAGVGGLGSLPFGRTTAVDRTHYLRALNDSAAAANSLAFDIHNGAMVDGIGQTTRVMQLYGNGDVEFPGTPRYAPGMPQPSAPNSFARRDFVLPATEKGAAGGVAPLDSNGRVATSRLPPQTVVDEFIGGKAGGVPPAAVGGMAAFMRNDMSAPKADGTTDFMRLEGAWKRHSDGPGWQAFSAILRTIIGTTEMGAVEYNAPENPGGVTFGARGGQRIHFTAEGELRASVAKVLNVKDFGAVLDGIADDAPAINLAFERLRLEKYGGVVYIPPGNARCMSSIYGWMNKAVSVCGSVCGGTTVTFAGMPVNAVGWAFTNQDTPTNRAPRVEFRNINTTAVGPGFGPCLFESLYASNLVFENTRWANYLGNTALRIGSMFNCVWQGNNEVWGAGVHRVRKLTPANAKFLILKDTTRLVSTLDTFGPEDVGERIWVSGEQFIITDVPNAREATVNRTPYRDHTAENAVFEGVRGSIAAGEKVLTLNAPRMSQADVGRVIYVFDAMKGAGSTCRLHLRTTITAVSEDGLSVTLADAPTLSVTKTPIALSPAVEILGGDLKRTNDARLSNLHIEQFRGVGLVVTEALNMFFNTTKVHALNDDAQNDQASMINVLWCNAHGYFEGDLEGMPCSPMGKVYVTGQSTACDFDRIVGVHGENTPFVTAAYNHGSGYVGVGRIFSANQAGQPTVDLTLVDDGSCVAEVWGPSRGAYAGTAHGRRLAGSMALTGWIKPKDLDGSSFPGPFASDAAAVGKVPAGYVYKRTDGLLAVKL